MNQRETTRNQGARGFPSGERKVVLVLGMHRSGTSALTHALSILGLDLPPNLLPATGDNVQGYFECRDLVRLNNALLAAAGTPWYEDAPIPDSWFKSDAAGAFREQALEFLESALATSSVLILKDPRLCRLLPFWRACFVESGVSVGCVLILRHPEEVARSLQARVLRVEARSAGMLSLAKAHLLWLRYALDAERNSRGLSRCFLTYDKLLSDWRRSVTSVVGALSLEPPISIDRAAATLERTLAKGLRHQRSARVASLGWPSVAARLYRQFDEHVEAGEELDLVELDAFDATLARARQKSEAVHETTVHAYSPSYALALKQLERARSSTALPPRILYVSGCPETVGHTYRVEHHVQALLAGGVCADWCAVSEVTEAHLATVSVVVVFRAVWDQRLSSLYGYCRERGIPIGFDIDDLVFEPAYMCERYFDYLRRLGSTERQAWSRNVAGWRRSLLEADFVLVSTVPLAEAARKMGKPAYVWSNGFSWQMLEISHRTWLAGDQKPSYIDGRVRLGYASGTPTHQKDFAQISSVLAAILAEKPAAILTVVGHLDLAEFPELRPHLEQIEYRPHVPHDRLPEEYARFDVNLAPLETGNPFCEAKSELKYFEAAVVEVPTVASATVPFRTVIQSGINGYCAEQASQWRQYLLELVEDSATRSRLGREARWHALVRFGPEAQCLDGLELSAQFMATRSARIAPPEADVLGHGFTASA